MVAIGGSEMYASLGARVERGKAQPQARYLLMFASGPRTRFNYYGSNGTYNNTLPLMSASKVLYGHWNSERRSLLMMSIYYSNSASRSDMKCRKV